jgi:hypothetical protein
MPSRTRLLALAAAITAAVAHTAGAQNLAVYGAAEAAGFGEGSAILGAALTPGYLGLNWVIGANVQTYRYTRLIDPATGTRTYAQNVAFTPSVGLQFRMPDGAVQGTVGYNFTSGDVTNNADVGVPGGGANSPVLAAQANYWGGIFEHEGIIAYTTKNKYLWSRARLAARPIPTTPVYVGGEFIYQGTADFGHRYQAGPTINFHITPNFHFGVDGGVRWNSVAGSTADLPKSGYVGVNFVALSAF